MRSSEKGEFEPIYVTRSFSPPESVFLKYVQQILQSAQFTNNGPLLQKFEKQLREFLGLDFCQVVTNGTLALQLALRALEDETKTEIITTPFSYVATLSSILWERYTPIFADIDRNTFCIDPEKVISLITPRTRAIMAVHVFGYPCDVEALSVISRTYGIPIIYDAAHAFGAEYHGRALLSYGDIATCSLHATKLFHTIEGGCVIVHDSELNRKIDLLKRFGHNGDEHFQLGINAKASEFQAAMGLTNLLYVAEIIENRRKTVELYDTLLGELIGNRIQRPTMPTDFKYNYAYYPVVFRSESELLAVSEALKAENIHLRRYFYPSLNTLPYLSDAEKCPISEDIALRIACLPLFYGMAETDVRRITRILCRNLEYC